MAERISVGSHAIDGQSGEVFLRGARIGLVRRQTLEVLRELNAAEGAVLSKEALMSSVWQDTAVTDDSLVQCIAELRKALGADRIALETVPRKGYRLMNAVPQAAADSGDDPVIRIMVAPFDHVGPDRDPGFVAAGITLDLVQAMSKSAEISVLQLEGTDNPRENARQAGAAFIVEGLVRFSGPRVVVNGTLRSVEGGEVIWSERFTAAAEDVFDIQDEITLGLARGIRNAIDGEIGAHSYGLRVGRTKSFEAWHLVSEANALYNDTFLNLTHLLHAKSLLERALVHDPDFPSAQIGLAELAYWEARRTGQADIARHLGAMDRLLARYPDEPEAYHARSKLKLFLEDWDSAEEDARNAIRAAPTSAGVLTEAAYTIYKACHYEEALWLNERAFELDPRRKKTGNSQTYCVVLLHLGRLEEADAAADLLLSNHPRYYFMKYYGAIIAFELGNISKAHRLYAELRKRAPEIAAPSTRNNLRHRDPHEKARLARVLTELEAHWNATSE